VSTYCATMASSTRPKLSPAIFGEPYAGTSYRSSPYLPGWKGSAHQAKAHDQDRSVEHSLPLGLLSLIGRGNSPLTSANPNRQQFGNDLASV
jgi:hypothetical protein